MSDEPPHHEPTPLDYPSSGAGAPPPSGRFARQFGLGIGIGILVSAIAYGVPWLASSDNKDTASEIILIAALTLLGLKGLIGIILLCFRNRRGMGAGLLVSLLVGFLIFFTTCASTLRI